MELLTVAGVTAIISFVLTLILQYFPKIRTWWGGVKSEYKALGFLAGYLLVGAAVAFGGCIDVLAGWLPSLLCVEPPMFLEYLFAVMLAMGAGQGMFALLPELGDVAAARAERSY